MSHRFVRPDENLLILPIQKNTRKFTTQFFEWNLSLSDPNGGVFPNSEHDALFLRRGGLGLGLGQLYIYRIIHQRCCDHENDQQDQHDIDQRNDIDFSC